MSSRKRARSITPPAFPATPLIVLAGGVPCHEKLIGYWREGKLVDGRITAEGQTFHVHRTAVMVGSEFLEGAFGSGYAESSSAHVTLPEISARCLEAALAFLYTGECEVAEVELVALLPAAAFLQIGTLVAAIAAKLQQRLTSQSCLDAWALADTHDLKKLANAAKETALNHFDVVATLDGFVGVPLARLHELLTDERLETRREELVHEAVMRWVRAQEPPPDDVSLLRLLMAVRYSQVERGYFERIVMGEPLLEGSLGARLFGQAFVSVVFGGIKKRNGFPPQRYPMRWSSSCKGPEVELSEEDTLASAKDHCESVVSATSLPATGKHLVELVFKRSGRLSGASLQGCYMVGVVSEAVSGTIDFGDHRTLSTLSEGFWGVDDVGVDEERYGSGAGIRRGGGSVQNAPDEAICAISGASLHNAGGEPRIFLNGDTVGLLVNMDARTLTIHRNGTPIPSLVFEGLPERVRIAATLDDTDSEVRIVHADE